VGEGVGIETGSGGGGKGKSVSLQRMMRELESYLCARGREDRVREWGRGGRGEVYHCRG